MNLELSDEQRLLAETARAFVDRHGDADPWPTICDAGWPGLFLSEEDGGADGDLLDLALVCEALGRGPISSPLIASSVLAALPVRLNGTREQRDRWLPGIAAGMTIGTWAVLEPGMHDEWSEPQMSGRGPLHGTKLLVPWADRADLIVVSTADGLRVVETAAGNLHVEPHEGLDSEPIYAVTFDGAASEPLGPSHDPVTVAVALDHAISVRLAYAVGAAERALELTVQHAKDRHQFGRPIGSFQAVAHRCAEMRADIDACRYLAYRAAWAIHHTTAPRRPVDTAKSYANGALRRIFQHAHQVHGAIGFSTEHPLHRLTRVAKAFELSHGSTSDRRQELATWIGLGALPTSTPAAT